MSLLEDLWRGGDGGNIILEVDEGIRTLMDFRYRSHYKAENGENGRTKKTIMAKRAGFNIKGAFRNPSKRYRYQ